MELIQAPALVGLHRKSIYSPIAEAAALSRAMDALAATRVAIPVYYGLKKLGNVIGDPINRRTLSCAFTNLNDLQTQVMNGTRHRQTYYKNYNPNFLGLIWYDMWPSTSDPDGSVSPYPGVALTATAFDNTSAGAIYHGGAVSPKLKQVLKMTITANAAVTEAFLIYDRVLTYDNCLYSASLQNMTNTVPAPRYGGNADGGLQIMFTSPGGTDGTAISVAALNYTSDTGVGASIPIQAINLDRLPNLTVLSSGGAPLHIPWSVSSSNIAATFIPLALQDIGAQNVTSLQYSAADVSGDNSSVTLVRPIALLCIPDGGQNNPTWEIDYITNIVNCEPIKDTACLSLLAFSQASSGFFSGTLDFAWS